jgi:hypothetical protein
MRRFWFFTEDTAGQPHFPDGVVPRRAAYVRSIYRLGETAGHAHLWTGGMARPDARMTGDYALHFHDVVRYDGAWHVLTTGATAHEHDIPEQPDWWLICALLRDADVAACAADLQMYNVGEIVDGEMSTETWAAQTQTQWSNRMEAGLYLAMPDVVNSDERLVVWLCNVLGLRAEGERGYRCPE